MRESTQAEGHTECDKNVTKHNKKWGVQNTNIIRNTN